MKLSITEHALDWFQQEWGFKAGDRVRIFVHYGGPGGFSIGVGKDNHADATIATVLREITFFVAESDAWYLEDNDLVVDYNAVQDDIVYDLK